MYNDETLRQLNTEIRGLFTKIIPRPSLFFDIEMTEHCNLNCKGCGSFAPLAREEFLDLDELERDLDRLSNLSGGEAHHINILGGEPLLHKGINVAMNMTRKFFPFGKIYLVTNGILLPEMKEDFWETCRDSDITIFPTKYPIKVDWKLIEKKAMHYGVKYKYISDLTGESAWLKTAIVEEGNRNEAHSFLRCINANFCTVLMHGKLYPCPRVAKIKHFNEYFGKNLHVSARDFINIYEVESLSQIMEFLSKPIPFCKYCNPFKYHEVEWGVSKKDSSEWVE